MDDRLERWAALTGLIAVAAFGITTVSMEYVAGHNLVRGPMWLWWVVYLAYLGAFMVDAYGPARWHGRLRTWPFIVQAISGAAAFALTPDGWAGVVLVVTAVSAAFAFTARVVALIVTAQTLLAAVLFASVRWNVGEVLVGTVLLGTFQAFAALVTLAQRREATAREELAATHAQLRATSAVLGATTRTAERLRIARDLHDLVGHQLTGLALELEVASHDPGDVAPHVDRAKAITKDLLRDVRNAVDELRTAPDGLEPALREVVQDVPGLTVNLSVDERCPVDGPQLLTLVRCVQEVLTNTLRHADATRLDVTVTADDGGVRLTARDDGRGVSRLQPGNGLTGLRERVQAHGGEVAFDGGEGTGFAVTARFPVS